MLILQRPEISQEDLGKSRANFVIEPLEPGFGLTLGNTMRRALLSRVPGVAVTGVKIDGVNHEFTSVPGVVEDVLDILLNLKRLVLKVDDQESHTLTVKAKGPGEVKAAQIQCPAGVEVVNTDLKICTLSNDSTLDMEVSIAHGVGYRLADKNKTSDSSFIPIDSIFSPVVKVSYAVSPTQVGQVTNYDKLSLDVETDGSIEPSEAISSVGKTLGELWKLFADIDNDKSGELPSEMVSSPSSSPTPSSISANSFHNSPKVLPTEEMTQVNKLKNN